MTEKSLVALGTPLSAQTGNVLIIEQFLTDNYLFRRNVLNGKVEFKARNNEAADYRPLTQEALNSIIIRARRERLDEECNPKTDITMYVNSEEVPLYNPIQTFLDNLPQWDGQNHVAKLFSRLPGISTEHLAFLAVWLRSTVAHWLQMDTMHGNEVVPVLIGAQGCGKTTFLRRLLPCELREYYLDHLNLSNKFDKEMALTNNLLVNLDDQQQEGCDSELQGRRQGHRQGNRDDHGNRKGRQQGQGRLQDHGQTARHETDDQQDQTHCEEGQDRHPQSDSRSFVRQ